MEERRISAKWITEQLGISREQVGSITNEDLDTMKLSAKWVPKCPNAGHKFQRCHSSEQSLEFFGSIQMISSCDWLSWTKPGYIAMTRWESNNQWIDGIAVQLAPNNSVCKNSMEIFSPWFFGIIDCLPKGHTINAENYSSLLVKLNGILMEKHDGKFTREVVFIQRQWHGTPYQTHKRSQPGNRHKAILRNFYRIWQKYRRFFQLNVQSRNSVKHNPFNVGPIWKVRECCKDDAAKMRWVLICP
jgi:hypothetical protein